MQDLEELSFSITITPLGIKISVKPYFDKFQPLFEIDHDLNISVQGKIIGKISNDGRVFFVKH